MSAERFPLRYGALTLAARAASAVKEVALATVLGTSGYKDALVAAWAAPALITSYGNEMLPALLTPVWARDEGGAAGVVAGVAGLQVGLSLAALAWPQALLRLITPGLHGATLATAITLERWLAINIALLGGHNLAAARLNAKRRFTPLPAAVALAAVTVVLVIVATGGLPPATRIIWIAAAITAGNLLGLAWLLLQLTRARRGPGRGRRGPAARDLWTSLLFLLAAMAVLNLVPLAERMAASELRSGSLAAYDYGERLVQWIFGLTVAPFTAVAFTRLAEIRDRAAMARRFEQGLGTILTLAIPPAAALAVFAPLLTRCVFGWGRFGAESVARTAPVVAIRGAGLVLDAGLYFALFAVFARGGARAKLPVAAAVAGVNVPLAFALAARDGVAGLALAHCAGAASGLGWILWRRRAYLPQARLGPCFLSAWRAGAVTTAAALAVRGGLPAAVAGGSAAAAASWAWATAALGGTGLIALLLARVLTPDILAELRHELWPARHAAAGAGS